MKTLYNKFCWLALGLLLVAAPACSAKFDKTGLDNVTNLSTALSDLMGKAATSKFSAQSDAIKKVSADLDKAVQHAAGKKKNKEVAEAWKTMQNDLVNPFLDRWKEKGMLDKDFVKESTAQVTKSLDAIKKAEMAKKK
ncbi:MAG: hypothetical protein SFV22_16460 [Saprospiraceae bacterium]|nr:hypothetical protein [Saprospiraceae bacterium]